MSKPNLIILCGCPGSGKTTWAKDYCRQNNYVHISRDEIRFELLDSEDEYFSKEDEVYDNFILSIVFNLKEGNNVIADATNLTPKSRNILLNSIKRKCKVKYDLAAVFCRTDLNTCLERNSFRTGRERVPDYVIQRMYNSAAIPQTAEGFEEIIVVENNKQEVF